MFARHLKLLFLVVLVCPKLAFAAGVGVTIQSLRDPTRKLVFKAAGVSIQYDLELGDDWDGDLKVDIREPADLSAEIMFETSVSVAHEGPHLDLTDWKHYRSPWKALHQISTTQFQIISHDNEAGYFPFTTKEELLAAVAKFASETQRAHWLAVANSCEGPNIWPCSVGITKVMIRVFQTLPKEKRLVKEITLRRSLGC